jgi:tetratricopeptide (TPR) repeat protein
MDRISYLNDLLKETPKDSFVLFALAKEYEKVGNLEQAQVFYETLKINQPDYIGLYLHLGKLYQKMGLHIIAIEVFKEGLIVAKKVGDFHALGELNAAINQEE